MATPPTHARKRQYQPSTQTTLNSYFGRHATSSRTQARSPMSPALPEDVQSSLVNVGMRVRKVMNDAHAPQKTLHSEALPSSSAPVRIMARQELQPFCGLHKTGGWAVQEALSSSAPPMMRQEERNVVDEEIPGLSMSQDTIPFPQSSLMSAVSSSKAKKRTYEDEAENDMDTFFDEDAGEAVRSQIPNTSRPIARMKIPTRKTTSAALLCIVSDEGDFPEADFLMPMEVE